MPKALDTISRGGHKAWVAGEIVAREGGEAVRCRGRRKAHEAGRPIGCGAVNLDLIYRLPASLELSAHLPARGPRRASTKRPARRSTALADHEPFRSGGGQAANVVYALRRSVIGPSCSAASATTRTASGSPRSRAEAPLVARHGNGRVYVLLDEGGERRNLVSPGTNDQFAPPTCPSACRTRASPTSPLRGRRASGGAAGLLNGCPETPTWRSTPASSTPPGRQAFPAVAAADRLPLRHRARAGTTLRRRLRGAIEFLLKVGVDTVVCKMGERGARLITNRDQDLRPAVACPGGRRDRGRRSLRGRVPGRPPRGAAAGGRRAPRRLDGGARHRRPGPQLLSRRRRLARKDHSSSATGAPRRRARRRRRDAPPAPPASGSGAETTTAKIGWLSTGRDPAACNLLGEVAERAARDGLPLDIALVFCDRERGESPRATPSSTWSSASASRPSRSRRR